MNRTASRHRHGRPPQLRPQDPEAGGVAEVEIETLGRRGDGIAAHAGARLFVAGALPGERARVRLTGRRKDGLTAEALEILSPSPDRRQPPCPHFGRCGGCAAQHLSIEATEAWKRRTVLAALARQGIGDVALRDTIVIGPGSRRRATFAARKHRGAVELGFNARESHAIIALDRCPILVPRLEAALPRLRSLAADLLREGETADLAAAALDDGIDLLLTIGRAPDLPARERIAAFAAEADITRIAWRPSPTAEPELLIQSAPVTTRFGGVPVTPPPGAFLQPSAAGEQALIDGVLRGLAGARRIADLFCGCGTFALPLAARGARVEAVDLDAPALAALEQAARRAGAPGSRVSTVRRNLFRDPLPAALLSGHGGLVFDPPRAGAEAQAREIAQTRIPRVIAVSCNPTSFARDARALLDGGYALAELQIVDQFVWSHHVELIALFRR